MERYTRKKDSRELKAYDPKDFKKLSYKEKMEYLRVAGITQSIFSHKK